MIIFPALLGLALCVLNAAGANLFCLTTGCSLYAGYSLFGLSFSVYGAIGFGIILLLAIRAQKGSRAPLLLGATITAGLALDSLFLGWQIFFWPCSSCLVMAMLLGWTALSFRRSYPHLPRRLFKGVLIVWLILLIPVTIATGKEVFLSPWAIYGPTDASIRVFFSPTCPACQSEVTKLLQSSDVSRIAFYPIAKSEVDLRLLAARLQEGITQPADLEKLFLSDPIQAPNPPLRLRWRLAKNKMALAGYGAQTIPFILSPKLIEGARPPWENLFSAPESAPSSGDATGCGAFGQEELPCD